MPPFPGGFSRLCYAYTIESPEYDIIGLDFQNQSPKNKNPRIIRGSLMEGNEGGRVMRMNRKKRKRSDRL
jgi:hypothetical protein